MDVKKIVIYLSVFSKAWPSLEEFCMHTMLSVNISKQIDMYVKSQNKDKPWIMYNDESLDIVDNFNYHSLKSSSNHRMNECATH